MFSYRTLEERIRPDHPVRRIRAILDRALKALSPRLEALYSRVGRPSIAPERLLRASLLQILYSVPSERRLMERLDHDLLFRWFVGLAMDDVVWDATTFTKNRERLLSGEIVAELFQEVLKQARAAQLLSDDHFSVDGTLIEAWASKKSYVEKPAPPPPGAGSGLHGGLLKRDLFESRTEPAARLYKKSRGGEAKLAYLGHALMENRNGLVVAATVTPAAADAERAAAVELLATVRGGGRRRITVAADKSYDEAPFVERLRELRVTPHLARYEGRRASAIDGRTTRHAGYRVSLERRKWIERSFGWIKQLGLLRRARLRGLKLVESCYRLAALAFNLVRLRKLLPALG
jgi:transposase